MDKGFVIAVLVGLGSGVFSAMGIGGGSILVLYLTIALGTNQVDAQGINLLYFVPVAVCALIVHAKNKCIDYRVCVYIVLFGLAGAAAGAFLANSLDAGMLKKVFAAGVFALGVWQTFGKND